MNLDTFLRERRDSWGELEALLARARRRPERLGPEGVLRLGELYRGAAADLAVARRRFGHDPVVPTLESLVGRARHVVYDSDARSGSIRDFLSTGYWRRIRERPALLVIAAVLTVVPAVLGVVWARQDPRAASAVVPGALEAVTHPRPHGANLGLPLANRSQFATQIFTNNIRLTILAFAGGMTGGLLTGWLLVFNGLLLGVVGGLALGAGQGSVFTQLVVPHGVLEMSCIVVAGVAGLRLGWALVAPGRVSRGTAIAREAKVAVELALGTALWLVLAGLVEGFITPAGFGLGVSLTIGFGLGALYWALVVIRGAVTPAPEPST